MTFFSKNQRIKNKYVCSKCFYVSDSIWSFIAHVCIPKKCIVCKKDFIKDYNLIVLRNDNCEYFVHKKCLNR